MEEYELVENNLVYLDYDNLRQKVYNNFVIIILYIKKTIVLVKQPLGTILDEKKN